MIAQRKSAVVSMLFALSLLLSGCSKGEQIREASATEIELCSAWNQSLPTRSTKDTQQTIDEIGYAYDVHIAACEMELPF